MVKRKLGKNNLTTRDKRQVTFQTQISLNNSMNLRMSIENRDSHELFQQF